MVDAVSNTSLAALKARMFAGRESMLQARPAPAPQASTAPTSSASAAASPYKRGSVESENVQMATGMAKAARTNIETLNMGVSLYNNYSRIDVDKVEALRKRRGGEKAVEILMISRQTILASAARMIEGASGKMAQEFKIIGTPLTRATDGSYKVGDFTQSASESGWSVSVKSNGQATAIANGVDVSAQVDDSSSSGFRWSALGQRLDIAA